jgi:hypothetical protein
MEDFERRINQANHAFEHKAKMNTPLQSHIVAEVENKPQSLRLLKPIDKMISSVPSDLNDVGKKTLLNLFKCFVEQRSVSEGLVGDVLWGFGQCGLQPEETIHGLINLSKNGYIKFQAKDGTFTDFNSSKIQGAWVRYQKKLTELVYEVRDG